MVLMKGIYLKVYYYVKKQDNKSNIFFINLIQKINKKKEKDNDIMYFF